MMDTIQSEIIISYRSVLLTSALNTAVDRLCVLYHVRFMQLIGVVPSDPSVLARLGELYDNEGDKSQAFQYYYDVSVASCRHFVPAVKFSFSPLVIGFYSQVSHMGNVLFK